MNVGALTVCIVLYCIEDEIQAHTRFLVDDDGLDGFVDEWHWSWCRCLSEPIQTTNHSHRRNSTTTTFSLYLTLSKDSAANIRLLAAHISSNDL